MNEGGIKKMGLLALVALGASAAHSVNAFGAAERGKAARQERRLQTGWKFLLDEKLTDAAALASTGAGWQEVRLPHTWNAQDAASTHATKPYKRSIGWYRLDFDDPLGGARKWLEVGAASIVADVWLNGRKLGQHKGAFTAFRYDVTDRLVRGRNVLLVKVDNRKPKSNTDPTAIIPLDGDFNMSGGLYRYVSLISTPDPVHFDLDDFGSSGVYATTSELTGGDATVRVRAKVKSDARRDGTYSVRVSLVDADGQVAERADEKVTLPAGRGSEVEKELRVRRPHLWQGVKDPYLYALVAELLDGDKSIDRVVQGFGIRQMRFDTIKGFFLNGEPMRLNGVAVHQDFQGKGWAVSPDDVERSLGMVKEIGANSIRLGHYPFSQQALDLVDKLGFVAWAEVPFGLGVTVQEAVHLGTAKASCPTEDATKALRENARQQLKEMIRQQHNHPSIAMWAVGNETTFMSKDCTSAPHDNITPVLRELNALAKREDPSRVTTLADFTEQVKPALEGSYIAVGGITDIWAINQYFLWYGGPVAGLGQLLDALHARYPNQPIGVSEYGAGAALTHHTDNVAAGPAESMNTGVRVIHQPEEYAAFVHEQNYAMLLSKPYVWGSYVWNMFDFGSGIRNEGDLRGVNTKGLVTFDRKIRKDPFFFYKANWSREPTTYIVGRRHDKRAYPTADVKVYTNADSVQLTVNGQSIGTISRKECVLNTCVFKGVKLTRGKNSVVAVGDHAGKRVTDAVAWTRPTDGINIAAGQPAAGLKSSEGDLFGSDNYFVGGAGNWLVEKGPRGVTDPTVVSGTDDPQLYDNFRHGTFSYFVPLPDGSYSVTLGFLEPTKTTDVGNRLFDVVANGDTKIAQLDVLKAAGAYRRALTRTFTATAAGGVLRLDFRPLRGEAVVSNIMIKRRNGPTTAAAHVEQ
ncbi:MAG TPA: glycoside hydrolase family 2 TIM barrel-domain containing protein [Polyangia bacterium]|nr:glycoside hydrolase family 2 TIM barrel-domain containing protein [Polyangia bacterium]